MILRSKTIKLVLTQISLRYGRESSRDSFEDIAILIKTIRQLKRQSNFSNLLVNTYEGVWGRRPFTNGGLAPQNPQEKICR